MDAVIVYESSFGNTATIARAIGDGIARHMPVRVVSVDDPAAVRGQDPDTLVVVGGPTHAFSMSRPQTRDDAEKRGAPHEGTGIREWIGTLPADGGGRYATFDTRINGVRHLPGSAARAAERALRRRGLRTVGSAESFYVADTEGPLLPDEEARARAWGEHLAEAVEEMRGR
ncbi:flavodoxin family protein [Antribacter sp. KLBMP9083]|uniref:Flavodoxin family protein n=1 Tax=Antribacter soli TaxID=2910976 RepID=A0AA41QC61_9MICO|nr:flavodoxin family protein [Antribacter soli]MCF4119916.1 flavodoxin family protein [Antribacter soli]